MPKKNGKLRIGSLLLQPLAAIAFGSPFAVLPLFSFQYTRRENVLAVIAKSSPIHLPSFPLFSSSLLQAYYAFPRLVQKKAVWSSSDIATETTSHTLSANRFQYADVALVLN